MYDEVLLEYTLPYHYTYPAYIVLHCVYALYTVPDIYPNFFTFYIHIYVSIFHLFVSYMRFKYHGIYQAFSPLIH